MKNSEHILQDKAHRPYPLPEGKWLYYQEWNRALFLHWAVPGELVRGCVPPQLAIDTFEGNCYISLVAFTMEKIRPRGLPSIGFLSNFDEINVRTYIDHGNKKGVYFMNIEASKSIAAFLAKTISGLPYEKADIRRTDHSYSSENEKKGFGLRAEFEIKEAIRVKTELDRWLTERYCLYLDQGREVYRYDIHHSEWELNDVEVKSLKVNYKIGKIDLNEKPPKLAHYSEGVKVIAWKRQDI